MPTYYHALTASKFHLNMPAVPGMARDMEVTMRLFAHIMSMALVAGFLFWAWKFFFGFPEADIPIGDVAMATLYNYTLALLIWLAVGALLTLGISQRGWGLFLIAEAVVSAMAFIMMQVVIFEYKQGYLVFSDLKFHIAVIATLVASINLIYDVAIMVFARPSVLRG